MTTGRALRGQTSASERRGYVRVCCTRCMCSSGRDLRTPTVLLFSSRSCYTHASGLGVTGPPPGVTVQSCRCTARSRGSLAAGGPAHGRQLGALFSPRTTDVRTVLLVPHLRDVLMALKGLCSVCVPLWVSVCVCGREGHRVWASGGVVPREC